MRHEPRRNPRISVVINNFNYGRYLLETTQSVLSQSEPPGEILVIDDGSTDDSATIIRSFGASVRPIFQTNGGQGATFNAGMQHSSGEWILFLDADDRLLPEAISVLKSRILQGVEGVSRIFWNRRWIDEKSNVVKEVRPERTSHAVIRDFSRELCEGAVFVVHPTSCNLFRKSDLDKAFPMPEEPYRTGADNYVVWKSAAYGKGLQLSDVLTDYRMHDRNDHKKDRDTECSRLRRDLAVAFNDLHLERSVPGREGVSFLESSHGQRKSILQDLLFGYHFHLIPDAISRVELPDRRSVADAYLRVAGNGARRFRDKVRICMLKMLPGISAEKEIRMAKKSRFLP